MAGCSFLYIKKHKPKMSGKKKASIWIGCCLGVIVGMFLIYNFMITPLLVTVSGAKIKALCTKALNTAVLQVLGEYKDTVYNDIISVKTDNTGAIAAISVNGIELNKLGHKLLERSQEEVDIYGEVGIEVPLGSFFGISLFSGYGPKINLKVVRVGDVECKFTSEFTSAGINQTNHKIYINLTTAITIVFPGINKFTVTETPLLVCDNIIVGKIPNTYLQVGAFDKILNDAANL